MFSTLLFLGTVVPGLVYLWRFMKDWLQDVFGSVAVTRSRVVWLTPGKRHIYREIGRHEIIDAYQSMEKSLSGSVTIVRRKGNGAEHIHLKGLADPDAAFSSLRQFITYGSPVEKAA